MVLVLFALIIYGFLLLGAAVFVVCVLIPQLRKYALSVALWFACWGPCVVVLMILAGVALIAGGLVMKPDEMPSFHIEKLLQTLGLGYSILGAIATIAVATVAATIHQFLIRRLTFALFRLYATGVSAGIGSTLGLGISLWMVSNNVSFGWLWSALEMLLLVLAFGALAFRGARALRGNAPVNLTWISPKEYFGR